MSDLKKSSLWSLPLDQRKLLIRLLRFYLTPIEIKKKAAEVCTETEFENESLDVTSALADVWSNAIRFKANQMVVDELEKAIVFEAKREWGEETIVDFDRDSRLMAVEHFQKGIRGFGNMSGLSEMRLPLEIDSESGEFYYDWGVV